MRQIQSCLRSACFISKTVSLEGASCLVHCDDGRDATCVLVSLAKLFIDPYYRTKNGFIHLLEEDWLQFGFPFLDRCGLLSRSVDGSKLDAAPSIPFTPSSTSFSSGLNRSIPSLSRSSAPTVSHSATDSSNSFSPKEAPSTANAGAVESPIFILFLDCVWQVMEQYPTQFEFNELFLCMIHRLIYTREFGK